MGWLKNLKVVQKLGVLIAVSSIAILLVDGIGSYFLTQANESMSRLYTDKLQAVALINDSRAHIRKVEADTYALMLTVDDKENQVLLTDISERSKAFDENLSKFEQLSIPDDQRNKLKLLKDEITQYRSVKTRVLDLAGRNENTAAYELFTREGKASVDKFTGDLYDLSVDVTTSAGEMYVQAEEESAFANKLFWSIGILSILLGVLLGWFIARQISLRLHDVVEYLEILSTGDFSREIHQESLQDGSEFGSVSRAVDKMKNHIRQLMKQLSGTSEQLAASSEQLTASAEQSAQASNQVADSVTEVAQGAEKQLRLTEHANNIVQQISTAITQVASNTSVVSASAEKTATTANEGEGAIQKAVTQMKIIEDKTNATSAVIGELEEHSKQIGQIVDAISNISGQTNLLALNAAIEAARAGEAGRGFAVVAEEVRKLAEQSQEAAKQITELIHEVQEKTDSAVTFMEDGKREVSHGAEVVSFAGQSFGAILDMVRNMTNQVHEISAAIEEITSGTRNVVQAVQEIDSESKRASEQTQTISAATQEQSASVEEIASASQHLANMAEGLQKEVRKFKV
jgi:methyl-accepting chemotaxis protein